MQLMANACRKKRHDSTITEDRANNRIVAVPAGGRQALWGGGLRRFGRGRERAVILREAHKKTALEGAVFAGSGRRKSIWGRIDLHARRDVREP
jgi:hypothetical protein